MPKVLKIERAAKDYPAEGIKKGDTYYRWSLRPGGPYTKGRTYRSKTYPTPRQLTQNAWKLACYDIEDAIQAAEDPDGLRAVIDDVTSLKDEQQEKLDNMPEGLQQGDTGQLLQERIDALESLESEIDTNAQEWEDKLGETCSECDGSGVVQLEDEGEDEEGECSECDGTGKAHDPDELAEEAKDGLSIDV